jgi:hypothetical protein
VFDVELGKPLFSLTSKEEGGVFARKHIEMEVEEVAKSECRIVMIRIGIYPTRKSADLQLANLI